MRDTCSERVIEGRLFISKVTGMSERQYFGLNGLDTKLEPYINFDGGVFFEAGANDGVNQSNTCYFERYRNWTGLLVEPIPFRYKACREARPNSQVIWSALVPPGWPDPFVELTYCNLMTVTNSDLSPTNRDQHVEIGTQFLDDGSKPHQFYAPASTISNILEKYGVHKIDLFSLDLEGFELPALEGIDFRRFDIDLLCIESPEPENVAKVLSHTHDFVEQISGNDYLFRKKS